MERYRSIISAVVVAAVLAVFSGVYPVRDRKIDVPADRREEG